MVIVCLKSVLNAGLYINQMLKLLFLFQYVLYIPGLTVLLKLPLMIPPISWHLDKIRSGYERGVSSKVGPNPVTLTKASLSDTDIA